MCICNDVHEGIDRLAYSAHIVGPYVHFHLVEGLGSLVLCLFDEGPLRLKSDAGRHDT